MKKVKISVIIGLGGYYEKSSCGYFTSIGVKY